MVDQANRLAKPDVRALNEFQRFQTEFNEDYYAFKDLISFVDRILPCISSRVEWAMSSASFGC